MNEIQNPNTPSHVASTQNHSTETTGVRRQQSQVASAASEIGAHAVRRGVHFNLNNDNSLNEQIRTYVRGQPETTQSIAEGDKEGKVLVNKRNVLRDLLQNIAQPPPSIESVGSFNTQRAESRWSDPIARPQSHPTTDTVMRPPARSTDQTSSSPDTAMRMPSRRYDSDDEI